jgi:hypothetical protein
MGEWLGWVLGWACGAAVAMQFVAACWCFLELHRNWRSVPELWGVDWLDVVYRLEWEFGVTLAAVDFEDHPATARVALTAGQLWELVRATIMTADREVPADGWERVVKVLAEALTVKPRRIAPGSRLYADLGMIYGIE